MAEIAISINNIEKEYRLGQISGGTLQGDIQSWWAKIRNREDPNLKLGQAQHRSGERFKALEGISLQIKKGEAVGIIGHNGAGKSTLLKLLSRVTAPTKGSIDIYGRVASMLEVGTGFNGEMTGRENIYLNGAILGMSKAEVDKKIEKIIDFSECGLFIDTPVKRYSSGMYVKLAFSVAAHLDAEIMIMDEVLAVGDMKFQEKCLGRMDDAAGKEGKTILYVSHNMNTIRQFCTRCLVLDHGRMVFDGEVEEAISIYMDKASYSQTVHRNISNIYQKYLSPFPKAKMMNVTLVGKEQAVYDYKEQLVFELGIKARENTMPMSLRFEVRASDGTSVGTSFIFNFTTMKSDEERVYTLVFENEKLVPGSYYVVLGLFEKNEYGSYSDIDVVENAFGFEIKDDENELGIMWLKKYWGNIKFSDMRMIN